MAWDGAAGNVVLFGGIGDGAFFKDTWTWDGTSWTQQFPPVSTAWFGSKPNKPGSSCICMLTRFLGLRYDLPQYWWLSLKQAQALLNAPDITTMKGLRARAIMAALLGCALRRSEVAALTMNHATPKQCLVTYIQ
jgi:hypothetical protein